MIKSGLRFVACGVVAMLGGGCALLIGYEDATLIQPDAGTGGATTATTSTGSQGGGGGTGGSSGCKPGSTAPCYSGPDGTQGVGICKAGTKTCNAEGTAYGACSGDVTPGVETCAVAGDENCDGVACSDNEWSFLAGDASNQVTTSMAIDPTGNILVAGYFDGTLKFLNKANNSSILLNTAGGADFYLAKFSPSGDVLWGKSFGSAGDNGYAITVAVDANGNVAISGTLLVSASFGGPLVTGSSGSETLFIVMYDSAGTHKWTKNFVATTVDASVIAFDSAGDVVIGGSSSGAMMVGATTFSDTGGRDALVAKFAGLTGTPVWAKQYKEQPGMPSGNQAIYGLALDGLDNIYITGSFSKSIFLQGNVNTVGGGFDEDAFAAKLDSTGVLSWRGIWGTPGLDAGSAIAVDSSANVIVSGYISTGSVNFGGGSLTTSGGNQYTFLAKYTNAGVYSHAEVFTGVSSSDNNPTSLATDAADNVYLTGEMGKNLDLGGGALVKSGVGSGFNDIFLGKFDSGLNHIWSKSFGAGKPQESTALRYDKSGSRLVLVGAVVGSINFGTGLLTAASSMPGSNFDFALAKFYP
jgi:hypothetical protein